jgi:isopenicillin N synthase-like dioxygenase
MSQPILPSVASAVKLAALPVIDISPWLDGHGQGRLSTSAALHAAVLEYGFFYLRLDNLPTLFADPAETEELTRLAREFFARPQDEKDRIGLRHQDGARGVWMAILPRFISTMDAQGTNA